MLLKCILKNCGSIPNETAVLEEQKFETIVYTHECQIGIEIQFQ